MSSHYQNVFTSVTPWLYEEEHGYVLDLTLCSEKGIATHWYGTGQAGPCRYVPEAVHLSFQSLSLDTV